MSSRWTTPALLLIGWGLLVGQGSCGAKSDSAEKRAALEGVQLTFMNPEGEDLSFQVEVVQTAVARGRGLMFRKELADDRGMLFLFSHLARHSFYMKNTEIPLDIVFLDRSGAMSRVVGVLHDMKPFDETSRSIETPSYAAVEIPAGLARKYGIKTGTEVRITQR